MAVKFDDTQLQLLYDSLKAEIDPLKQGMSGITQDITRMNNSINRLHDKFDSQSEFFKGFMEDTRNRLNKLERKTA